MEKSYNPSEGAEMWGWEKDRYRRKPTAALLSRQIAKLKPIPGVGAAAVTVRATFPLNTEKRRKETSMRTKWEDAKKLEAELLESGELTPGSPKKKAKGKGKKKKEKVVKRRSVIAAHAHNDYPGAIKVHVQLMTGETVDVEVGEISQRMFDVKDEIEDKIFTLYPPTQRQKLIHDGKLVEEDQTLVQNDIKPGSTLRLVNAMQDDPKMQPFGQIQEVDIYECCSWPKKKPAYVHLCWCKEWYICKVLSTQWLRGAQMAKLLPFGYSAENEMLTNMSVGNVQKIVLPKRSLAFVCWDRWDDKINIETEAKRRGVDPAEYKGDSALRYRRDSYLAGPGNTHIRREKGMCFRTGDCCRVHLLFEAEFEPFDQMQLYPVGTVIGFNPERATCAVKTEHFMYSLVCHYPMEQLQLVTPFEYKSDADIIKAARHRVHEYQRVLERAQHPVVLVKKRLHYVAGQRMYIEVVDSGHEILIHALSPMFRKRFEVVIGDEELQAMGFPHAQCPILFEPASLPWLPLCDRAPLGEKCMRFLHAEAGGLVVDCTGWRLDGETPDTRRKPLWQGGWWVHAPNHESDRHLIQAESAQRRRSSIQMAAAQLASQHKSVEMVMPTVPELDEMGQAAANGAGTGVLGRLKGGAANRWAMAKQESKRVVAKKRAHRKSVNKIQFQAIANAKAIKEKLEASKSTKGRAMESTAEHANTLQAVQRMVKMKKLKSHTVLVETQMHSNFHSTRDDHHSSRRDLMAMTGESDLHQPPPTLTLPPPPPLPPLLTTHPLSSPHSHPPPYLTSPLSPPTLSHLSSLTPHR
jgi:hypothetical protein